jgi:hypothetical protein
MDLSTVNGLPAHILLVHAVVVLVPLAALLVVLSAVWPAARRRLGLVTPVLALATTVVVPVTTDAGEWLERRVDPDPLVRVHTELGDQLLPWVIGLLVVGAAVWGLQFWLDRRTRAEQRALVTAGAGSGSDQPRPDDERVDLRRPAWVPAVTVVLAVLAVAVGIGSVVQVYRIGESGSRAAWHDGFSQTPTAPPGRDGG